MLAGGEGGDFFMSRRSEPLQLSIPHARNFAECLSIFNQKFKLNPLAKFCVFCGQKPESKNKEHIIPQWLIRMTGNPNREINLGFDARHFKNTGQSKLRTFNFKSFQFPACEKCNTKYSALEAKVSGYFKRIFDKDYFNQSEIDELLDWFDKVRIGLWLGYMLLDESVDQVVPKYHIERRIGHRDRALFFYELENDGNTGIQFIGVNTPGFQFIPSCFTLRVNNILFFNYSFDFLFSKQIGFPYPNVFAHTDSPERSMMAEFSEGSRKITLPLINQKFHRASNYIYQPILAPEILESDSTDFKDIYNTEYVKNNCFDYQKGRGNIFYFDRALLRLNDDTELQLYSDFQKLDPITFPKKIGIQTFETLEKLLKVKPQVQMLNEEHKLNIEKNRLAILTEHQKLMRLYKSKE